MLKFGRRLLCTGTPSPYPWDLSLSGNNGSLDANPCCILPPVGPAPNGTHICEEGRIDTRPAIAAAESALRSRPRGALSSAQLRSVLPDHMRKSRNVHGTASV
jgi:hypothetical protein